ncbi:MAG: methyltransferase regulatory domain-containing protein [Dongiaceae bacterium]
MSATAVLKTQKPQIIQTAEAYNEVPYESFPYPLTHPAHLYIIAKLFGLNAPAFNKARVLELGCAAGGNIIPLALNYPEGNFIGIDISSKQIEDGQKQVEALGLKNISLRLESITDIDAAYGTFDYIICHGIMSWVPSFVQKKIFEVCKERLSRNGVALISYNTFPGWNMVRSIRDMMRFHAARFPDKTTKTAQARAIIRFMNDGLKEATTPYQQFLQQEVKLLENQSDSYLYHDHLESFNEPFYFFDFAKQAALHGLQYLGEADIHSMFTGNLPPEVGQVLAAANDIVATEQYMDFFTNRRFRMTTLCHAEHTLNRHLDASLIDKFYISSSMRPKDPIESIDLGKDQDVIFTGPVNFTSHHRVISGIMLELSQAQGKPQWVPELITNIAQKLGFADIAPIKKLFHEHALRLVLANALRLNAEPGNYTITIPAYPKVSALARHQARTKQKWVTSQRHEKITIGDLESILLYLCDGTRNHGQLAKDWLDEIEKAQMPLFQHGKLVKSREQRDEIAPIYVNETLTQMAKEALLLE